MTVTRAVRLILIVGATLGAGSGCVDREKVIAKPESSDAWLVDTCSKEPGCQHVSNGVTDVDVLFVIDNSNSMKEEQLRMPTQFRRLVRTLISGDRDDDGKPDFPAARSLHLGVVSSDMGLSGVNEVKDCENLGDDGILLHAPSTDIQDCRESYPKFVSASAESSDLSAAADDFACMATLGITGCGFEQQLEAGLKALWPSVDPNTGDPKKEVRFLPDGMNRETTGHGDLENDGFLRNDPASRSVVAIVVLSDEDDGSARDPSHLRPKKFLDPNSPLYAQPLNLRNYYNPENLYPVTRYIKGYRALRPEAPELVVFGAIVGVPKDLAEPARIADIATDAELREGFYDDLLADSHMQEEPDPETTMTTPEVGTLKTSCATLDADGEPTGKAYPPRRIVEVARGFGANGFVHSICDGDFDPAIDALVDRIGARLGAGCLDEGLERDDDGRIASCHMRYELPPQPAADGPARCSELGDALGRQLADATDRLCDIAQVQVLDGEPGGGEGWYYDDTSAEAGRCLRGHGRIAFTEHGAPPVGARATLHCD